MGSCTHVEARGSNGVHRLVHRPGGVQDNDHVFGAGRGRNIPAGRRERRTIFRFSVFWRICSYWLSLARSLELTGLRVLCLLEYQYSITVAPSACYTVRNDCRCRSLLSMVERDNMSRKRLGLRLQVALPRAVVEVRTNISALP